MIWTGSEVTSGEFPRGKFLRTVCSVIGVTACSYCFCYLLYSCKYSTVCLFGSTLNRKSFFRERGVKWLFLGSSQWKLERDINIVFWINLADSRDNRENVNGSFWWTFLYWVGRIEFRSFYKFQMRSLNPLLFLVGRIFCTWRHSATLWPLYRNIWALVWRVYKGASSSMLHKRRLWSKDIIFNL